MVDVNRDIWTVELPSGAKVKSYPSGKLRKFKIRILVGDRVQVEISPYDLGRGRMVHRRMLTQGSSCPGRSAAVVMGR
ncbi:MAG: translation initiation factor IF-1 [Streptosporangiaceae bacterium]